VSGNVITLDQACELTRTGDIYEAKVVANAERVVDLAKETLR